MRSGSDKKDFHGGENMSLHDKYLINQAHKEYAAELKRQHAQIEAMRDLLAEAGNLFRFYEQLHRAKGPGHEDKAKRNGGIALRIEGSLAAANVGAKAQAPVLRRLSPLSDQLGGSLRSERKDEC